MHVLDDGVEILDHLQRVRAAFLELADIGREAHVFGIHGLHNGIRFIVILHASAGVLV